MEWKEYIAKLGTLLFLTLSLSLSLLYLSTFLSLLRHLSAFLAKFKLPYHFLCLSFLFYFELIHLHCFVGRNDFPSMSAALHRHATLTSHLSSTNQGYEYYLVVTVTVLVSSILSSLYSSLKDATGATAGDSVRYIISFSLSLSRIRGLPSVMDCNLVLLSSLPPCLSLSPSSLLSLFLTLF